MESSRANGDSRDSVDEMALSKQLEKSATIASPTKTSQNHDDDVNVVGSPVGVKVSHPGAVKAAANGAPPATGSTPEFGARSKDTRLSFSALASGAVDAQALTPSKKEGEKHLWKGEGQTVFRRPSTSSEIPRFHSGEKSVGEDVEDFVPNVEFRPIVPLPDLVQLPSGDEHEEVLFCERARLFRFTVDEHEGKKVWKERGIGEMKILRNPETGKARLLMRREVIHKICCNQLITAHHSMTPLLSSDRAWMWVAPDFAEKEDAVDDTTAADGDTPLPSVIEQLAVRFKTTALANVFKAEVDWIVQQEKEKGGNVSTSDADETDESDSDTSDCSKEEERGGSGDDEEKKSESKEEGDVNEEKIALEKKIERSRPQKANKNESSDAKKENEKEYTSVAGEEKSGKADVTPQSKKEKGGDAEECWLVSGTKEKGGEDADGKEISGVEKSELKASSSIEGENCSDKEEGEKPGVTVE